jgi:hypothetical protein
LKVTVKDGTGTDLEAEVYQRKANGRAHTPGLNVYTQNRLDYVQRSIVFLNDDFGRSMNINASASGATQLVHDGGDTSAWTGSNIVGSDADFASTTFFIAGAASVQIDAPAQNDIWEFDKGSSQALTAYDVLLGQIYITKDWGVGDSVTIYGWDGAIVGTSVKLEDYINELSFGVTQDFSIPLADMGLANSSITGFRMEMDIRIGKAPIFYLDTLTLSESATAQFTAAPAQGKVVEIHQIDISAAFVGTTLSYNEWFGETLSIGVGLQRFEGPSPGLALNYTQLSDILSAVWETVDHFHDGVNTFVKLRTTLSEPSVLEGSRGDRVVITIADDLSPLLMMSAILNGKEYVSG